MTSFIRFLTVFLLMQILTLPAFSQSNTDDTSSKSKGLKRISTRSSMRNVNVNVHIDSQAIETNIKSQIENAMKSMDVALAGLQINIEPIEVHLENLNVMSNPIEINIPNVEVNIDPIEIDPIEIEPIEIDPIDVDVDVDVDEDHADRGGDEKDK